MSVRDMLSERWTRWLDRRIPPACEVVLGHRSIFILPTRTGWLFVILLVLLLVTAINYQNSLIYALTFWLFSVSLVAMLFTFRNMAALKLKAGHVHPVFAGDTAQLPLRMESSKKRSHEALYVGYPENVAVTADAFSDAPQTVTLSYRTYQRGWLQTGRLRVESRFPLGLFKCWTWVKLDFKGLVYPQPENVPFIFAAGEAGDQIAGMPSRESGQQDFHGLRAYQPGDSLRIIAWKQVAQGKGIVSKEFDHDEGATCWLDWQALAPMHTEIRLSRLTGWVLEAQQRNWRYGLCLPGVEIKPDNTEAHRDECLRALALFGIREAENGR